MPFVKTWSEELVAEWLTTEKYLVEKSAPYATRPVGGRLEADLLGVKIENEKLHIRHVEVGNLTGSTEKSIQTVINKFHPSEIARYCKEKLGFSGQAECECIYVVTYSSKKKVEAIDRATDNIKVKRMEDFIKEDVLPAIESWKSDPSPYKPKIVGESVALPDSLWLLHLLDYIKTKMGDLKFQN